MSTFKIDITMRPLFSLISYLLVPKIEICFKYLLYKSFQKQLLFVVTLSPSSVLTQLGLPIRANFTISCAAGLGLS